MAVTIVYEGIDGVDFSEDSGDEDIIAIEEKFSDAETEFKSANDEIENKASALMVAVEALDDYNNKRIDFQQFRYSVFAAEAAAYGDVAMASPAIATEAAVFDRMAGAINELALAIKVGFSKSLDYLQYSYSLFTLQRGKVNSLLSKLQRASSETVNIKVGVNKYMRFGENQNVVRDMKEYNSEYRKMAEAMTPFTHAIADLTEEDLFSGLRVLKEGLIGDPEKAFIDKFHSIQGHLKSAMAGISGFKTTHNKKFVEYSSPVLLGLSGILVRMPEPSTYRNGQYEDYYGAHRYLYAYVDRRVKIKFSTMLDGSVELVANRRELIKNLEESQKLIEGALKLTAMGVRWSNDGAAIDSGYILGKRKQEEGFTNDIFETMMFYRRVCTLIYDSVSSAYNFSLGNIKQMNRIAERALDKM